MTREPWVYLQSLFSQIDTNGSNLLSPEEFKVFCDEMEISFSARKWNDIFAGTISLPLLKNSALVVCYSYHIYPIYMTKIPSSKMFIEIDRDFSGEVSLDELTLFLYPENRKAKFKETQRLAAIEKKLRDFEAAPKRPISKWEMCLESCLNGQNWGKSATVYNTVRDSTSEPIDSKENAMQINDDDVVQRIRRVSKALPRGEKDKRVKKCIENHHSSKSGRSDIESVDSALKSSSSFWIDHKLDFVHAINKNFDNVSSNSGSECSPEVMASGSPEGMTSFPPGSPEVMTSGSPEVMTSGSPEGMISGSPEVMTPFSLG